MVSAQPLKLLEEFTYVFFKNQLLFLSKNDIFKKKVTIEREPYQHDNNFNENETLVYHEYMANKRREQNLLTFTAGKLDARSDITIDNLIIEFMSNNFVRTFDVFIEFLKHRS